MIVKCSNQKRKARQNKKCKRKNIIIKDHQNKKTRKELKQRNAICSIVMLLPMTNSKSLMKIKISLMRSMLQLIIEDSLRRITISLLLISLSFWPILSFFSSQSSPLEEESMKKYGQQRNRSLRRTLIVLITYGGMTKIGNNNWQRKKIHLSHLYLKQLIETDIHVHNVIG